MTKAEGHTSYVLKWIAIDKRVLVFAIKGNGFNYEAYVGAVKGENYDEESLEVAVNGSMVPSRMAEVYFKDMPDGPRKPLLGRDPYYFPSEWFAAIRQKRPTRPPGVLGVCPVDKHVLFVAVERPGNTWAALVGAVKGEDYYQEAADVVANGSEVGFEVAETCFEDLARDPDMKWHHDMHPSSGKSST